MKRINPYAIASLSILAFSFLSIVRHTLRMPAVIALAQGFSDVAAVLAVAGGAR